MTPTSSKSPRSRGPRMVQKYRNFYVILFTVILVGVLVTGFLQFWPHSIESLDQPRFSLRSATYQSEITVPANSPKPRKGDESCTFHSCFDVYHCGYNDDNRISIYIYPLLRYLDENGVSITMPISKEFNEVLTTVQNSIYYTPDPDKACLFLPSVDLLNQNNIRLDETAQVLATLSR